MQNVIVTPLLCATLLTLVGSAVSVSAARTFSIADDIGMTTILRAQGANEFVHWSPDGTMLAVVTERGVVAQDVVEDSVWIWKAEQLWQFVQSTKQLPPSPIALVRMATFKKGPIISSLRWRSDSSGVLFLGLTSHGTRQVYAADTATNLVVPLTPEDQDAVGFDFRGNRLVYAVRSADLLARALANGQGPAYVAGKDLTDLVFPFARYPERLRDEFNLCDVWAIVDGHQFQIKDARTGAPVHLYEWSADYDPQGVFALSPDGRFVAAIKPVDAVPRAWGLYRPEPDSHGRALAPGPQNPHAFHDLRLARTYVLIELATGAVQPLVDAPDGVSLNWFGFRPPRWSQDSKRILLPNTFLPPEDVDTGRWQQSRERPFAAVVDVDTRRVEPVLPIRSQSEQDYDEMVDARFDALKNDSITFDFGYGQRRKTITFHESKDGHWARLTAQQGNAEQARLAVEVKQDLNEPPVLSVTEPISTTTRVFWDPNPQFHEINIGEASVFHWKDRTGHEWRAGLIKPPQFVAGERYPLVIQTHGFFDHNFITYGSLSTAFAARELAAAGFVVLQMPDELTGVVSTEREASRYIAGVESAVERLGREGLINTRAVGMVGFSRTCYYVLQTLTASKLRIAAASITDGATYGYWEFLGSIDHGSGSDAVSVIGSAPFGSGLRLWLVRSPLFNMQKVRAPLLVVSQGPQGLFWQWGEYAALRYLGRPVELLDLGDENYEHVLTNPGKRLASMGSTVDWMRFWLQGYEDPDPGKAEQYTRWREMRKQQITKSPAQAIVSK